AWPLGRRHEYAFWDAYYKNLLIDDPAREAWLRGYTRALDPSHRPAHEELRLGAWLDSFLRFNDLWTFLGYRRFFTVWNFLALDQPFRPRRLLPDRDRTPDSVEERYPSARRALVMELVRQMFQDPLGRFGPDGRPAPGDSARFWATLGAGYET